MAARREMLQDVLEELSVLSRHRRLAHQKHKVAGAESTLARLESARSLDSLILHMQERSPRELEAWGPEKYMHSFYQLEFIRCD